MHEKRWVFAGPDKAASLHLARALNLSPITAALLVNRGVGEPADAKKFLQPDLGSLIDPLRFKGMDIAVDRLEAALKRGEKIGIFGDYDVDGTTGTAILTKLFTLLGHPVAYRIPHRVDDGYGLNGGAVEAFAEEGVRVLITIDCGTNDREEVALATKRGIDVIILDHHEPGAEGSEALAVINPKLKDSAYGFTGICSAGISFKLAWALADRVVARRRPGFDGFILDAMGLAALGTVADVCPLIGENRVYVRYGLDALRACKSPGLRALLGLAKIQEKAIDTFDISFKLAPRLNALGRVGTAMDCVDLLVSEDGERIEEILKIVEKSNRNRKGLEDENVKQALVQVEEEGLADGAIVVADDRWHVGVVGIVAAKLVDKFRRPAFVLAIEDGVARGSGRSVEGCPLHEALDACRDLILTGGGHAMAAGVSLKVEKLAAFRRKMRRITLPQLTGEKTRPTIRIDDEVTLGSVTKAVARELERLAPHGPGNPPPVLAATNLQVAGEPRLMGKKNNHLSCYLKQDGVSIRAVGFGMGDLAESMSKARSLSVAFAPQINAWRGHESVEIHLKDVKIES